ncbi:hypothetical protein [Cetobacterium sp.]|uniref:hypothetical protein n=1 Tax=Cetobacterium sp. TaxID=2071632 RepID=UPI003F382148
MTWICRLCGGKLRVIVTKHYSNTHNIDVSGKATKRAAFKDESGETIGENYYCKKCDIYYEDGTLIKNIGVWNK